MNKYEIIAVDIREDIIKGIYKPNEKLPFEKEICSKYNASKMTVKKALDLLVSEGLIVKGVVQELLLKILLKKKYME